MPRELFGNVTRPSISVGSRKWYAVPPTLLNGSLPVVMTVTVQFMLG